MARGRKLRAYGGPALTPQSGGAGRELSSLSHVQSENGGPP